MVKNTKTHKKEKDKKQYKKYNNIFYVIIFFM